MELGGEKEQNEQEKGKQGQKNPNITFSCFCFCFPQGQRSTPRTFLVTMPVNWADECRLSMKVHCDDYFLSHNTSQHPFYVVKSLGSRTDIFAK